MSRWTFPAIAVCGAGLVVGIHAAQADEKAQALVKALEQKTKAINAMSAKVDCSMGAGAGTITFSGTMLVQRPHNIRVVFTGNAPISQIISDGTSTYMVTSSHKYLKMPGSAGDGMLFLAPPTHYFFALQPVPDVGSGQTKLVWRYTGKRTADKDEFDVVEASVTGPQAGTVALYIGTDGLLHRATFTGTARATAVTLDTKLSDIRTDDQVQATPADFKLPADAKPVNVSAGSGNDEAKLLRIGAKAPDFMLRSAEGGHVSLASVRRSARATLVNFWFFG